MNAQDSEELVRRLYDRMVESLTQDSAGHGAAFNPDKTFITLEGRGRIINPPDYAGAWSPGNLNGSIEVAQTISDLADDAPNFSVRNTPSGAKVSDLYAQVLRATVTQQSPPDPKLDAAYKKAHDFLYVTAKDPDNPDIKIETQSPVYQNYVNNQNNYNTAVSAFRAAFANAMTNPSLKATWPFLAPSLQMPVTQAWHAWRAAQADQVEAALATLETSGKDQVKRAFSDAALLFDSYRIGTDEAGGIGNSRRTTLLPSNWYDPGNMNGWPTFHFDYATASSNQSSDYTSAGGGGGFSLGLWSVGASASHTSSQFHSDASAQNIHVEYKYAVITIRRPWVNSLLFGLPGWKTDAFAKGNLSSGSRRGQNNTKFPLLPLAFIAIKGLHIRANLSESEVNQAKSAIQAGGSVGWGPFSVSGSYSHGHQEQHVKGAVSPAGIDIPFVQIIATIHQIVPFCPPE